jgi:hypothetical protein
MNKLLALTAVLGLGLVGCASYSPMGLAYTGGTTGLSVDNNVKPVKTGEACVKSFFGLFTFGDGSIAQAKADGEITKVATVDYDVTNYLGAYGQYCTIVKGE